MNFSIGFFWIKWNEIKLNYTAEAGNSFSVDIFARCLQRDSQTFSLRQMLWP